MRLAAQKNLPAPEDQCKQNRKRKKMKVGIKNEKTNKWLELWIKLVDRQSVLTGKETKAALFTWLTKSATSSPY